MRLAPRWVLGLCLCLGGQIAAAPARATSPEPPRLGPEWISPRDPIHGSLRSLSIRGLLPLGTATIRRSLRSDIAAWSHPLRGRDTAPNGIGAGGVSATRIEREFAEELSLQGTSNGAALPVPVTPAIDTSLGEARLRIRPYAWFEGIWRGGEAATWGDRARVGIAGVLHVTPHLTIDHDFFAGQVEDGRRFGDALVNHTDFLLMVESAGLTYARPKGFLRLGRYSHAWGPGRSTNLLVAPTSQPFDQFEWGLPLGNLRFRALVGRLDPSREKNVALHRLEWSPHPRWLLSVSEGAIFHGSTLDPLYLLGIVPYSIMDRVEAQDAFRTGDAASVRNNVLAQADLLVRFRKDSIVWAEVLIDDVGTESSDHPTRLGFLLGAETELGSRAEWNFGVELAKVYNYVYSVYYDDSDWSHQARPLGFHPGPDAESASAFLGLRPSVNWEVGLDLAVQRRGEGRIGRPWEPLSDPDPEGSSPTSASTLSGTVERRLSGALSLTFAPSAALRVELRGTRTGIEDLANQAGVSGDDDRVDLAVRWHR